MTDELEQLRTQYAALEFYVERHRQFLQSHSSEDKDSGVPSQIRIDTTGATREEILAELERLDRTFRWYKRIADDDTGRRLIAGRDRVWREAELREEVRRLTAVLADSRRQRDGVTAERNRLAATIEEFNQTHGSAVFLADNLAATKAERDEFEAELDAEREAVRVLDEDIEHTIAQRDEAQTRAEEAEAELAATNERYERVAVQRDRLAEKLRQYEWPGTPTYQQLAASHAALLDQQDEWRREMREMGAEYERLAETVRRVRELHAPTIVGEGDTQWCSVCSQDEEQPQPVGWWVPWPCPTIAALDPAAAADAVNDAQSISADTATMVARATGGGIRLADLPVEFDDPVG